MKDIGIPGNRGVRVFPAAGRATGAQTRGHGAGAGPSRRLGPGQARDPLYEFTNFLRAAMNSKTELPQIEARLLRMLAPDAKTSPAGKDFVCRQLSIIGTAASVPTLARLLNDPSMAEIARYTLARIPGRRRARRCAKPCRKRPVSAQAGIINALGERRDAQAVPALKNLLGRRPTRHISDAALAALAHIGDSRERSPPSKARWRRPRRRAASPFCARMSAAPMRSRRRR